MYIDLTTLKNLRRLLSGALRMLDALDRPNRTGAGAATYCLIRDWYAILRLELNTRLPIGTSPSASVSQGERVPIFYIYTTRSVICPKNAITYQMKHKCP
jgi:hypothetical protein